MCYVLSFFFSPSRLRARRCQYIGSAAARPPLRRAVCRLLTPDYRCFGYDQASCEEGLVRGRPLEPKARLKEELRPLLLGVGAVVLVLLAPARWVARRADRRQRQEAGGVKML